MTDVLLQDGTTVTVPPEQAAKVAASTGGQIIPEAPLPEARGSLADTPIDTGLGMLKPGSVGHSIATKAVENAAGIFGAGKTATMGAAPMGLLEGAYIFGGDKLREDVRRGMLAAAKASPRNEMVGEGAGLFLGPIGEIGSIAEAPVAARVGEGLLGSALSMGARGAVEGAALDFGEQISEAALGDPQLRGQQIFSHFNGDRLLKSSALGGALGAATGVGGYYLGKAAEGLLAGRRGPAADAVLDEIAGVPGGGRVLHEDAKATEALISDLQRTGATSEQAAIMADEISQMAKTRTEVDAAMRTLPHEASPEFRPFSKGEVAQLEIDEGITPVRKFQYLPIESLPQEPVWDPTKIDSLKRAIAEGKKLPPIKAGMDEAGQWTITDGIHRTALSREMGMTHVPAITTEHVPIGQAASAVASGGKQAGGLFSGLVDEGAAAYAAKRAGGNAELGEVLAKGYAERATRLAERGEILDKHALNLKSIGDRVMKAERALDEVQFGYKAEQMARLVDPARGDVARDAFARMMQETEQTLGFLQSLATKGGSEGAVAKLGKELTDASKFLATLGRDGTGKIKGLAPKQMHELFIRADQMKRAVGRASGAGKTFGLTEAQGEFRTLYEKLRLGLEDEAVWGQAGAAQREWNETFSQQLGRADDFANRFSVRVDNEGWSFVPEMDAQKVKNGLLRQLGSEADSQQAIKSVETWMDRNAKRIAAIEKHGALDAAQSAALADGRAALGEFKGVLGTARKESEIIARLERQQLEEQGRGLGGLLGLVGDVMTKPLTTMERLAQVRSTTAKVESAIAGGLERFFGMKGGEVVERLAPRAKDVVAKEIGEIREIASNPTKLMARVDEIVGDLSKHAPEIANEIRATATRALTYLANEAPPATTRATLMGRERSERGETRAAKPRYSDQQIAEWEAKRRAVLGTDKMMAPQALIADMKRGKLNREALKAMEFVSPKLFAQVQATAWEQMQKWEAQGLLARMPYQSKAAFATLLHLPADGTWQPDFIAMMQVAKQMPPPQSAPMGPPHVTGTTKRPMKMNTAIYATESAGIEKGMDA